MPDRIIGEEHKDSGRTSNGWGRTTPFPWNHALFTLVSYPAPTSAKMADAAEDGSGDYLHISWPSPAIRELQLDCRYMINNEQITCRSHERALVRTAETELLLVKRTVEPLHIHR